MYKVKPRFLKPNYKKPKKANTDGVINLYNPFTHKKELETTKKIDKLVKKENKK
jgi:hypothetical protein